MAVLKFINHRPHRAFEGFNSAYNYFGSRCVDGPVCGTAL